MAVPYAWTRLRQESPIPRSYSFLAFKAEERGLCQIPVYVQDGETRSRNAKHGNGMLGWKSYLVGMVFDAFDCN